MSRVSGFFPILYFDRGYNLEYNIPNHIKIYTALYADLVTTQFMCQYTTATHLIDTSRCEHGHMTDQLRDRRALRRRRPERQTHT